MKELICFITLLSLSLSVRALVVLQYHHVSTDTPKATSVSPALFEQHLDYLLEQDFHVLSLDELAGLLREAEPLPDKAVVITFDDGYRSVFEEAWPRLKERQMPFAVFINTEPHDQENPLFMSWQQMRNMAQQGVIFANHTVSHPHLIRRGKNESRDDWRARARQEIVAAENAIERELGQSHRFFAYPYGEYNQALQNLLKREGFLAFGQHSGPVATHDDLQALPRFPMGGEYGGLKDFATKVQTRPMPLVHHQVLTEQGDNLEEPELPADVARPLLQMTLREAATAQRVTCFASAQGAIPTQAEHEQVTAQAGRPLAAGRSRYNCTAATAEAGRFYWYSKLFIRRRPDGSWYAE